MENNFLESIIEVLLSERLEEATQKDKAYEVAVKEEARLFDLLNEKLGNEEFAVFIQFFIR